jgi:succinate dehydrogenase / fumarate reductase, cytochrome b subunit
MSKSAILSSSIVKKYWMALTGLFLCLFLVGHLAGNLQLITHTGEAGKLAFNQYGYFMATNPFIKILAYLTYFSILFHAIDGFMLTYQNAKARPQKYAHNKPGANSSTPSRYMAVLGTLILIFICLHMANFWYKSKISGESFPLHKISVDSGQGPKEELYVTQNSTFLPVKAFTQSETGPAQMEIKNGTDFYNIKPSVKMGAGYKDLHGLVFSYFGKTKDGFPKNENAWLAVAFYVISMGVLAFHLLHGFSSAFQTLGLRTRKFGPAINFAGKVFAIVVPALFALIPILIHFS